MRNIFGDRYEYSINGEPPKGTHEIIQVNRSPDFLAHRPKSMASNLTINEVKPFSVVKAFPNVVQDLNKLDLFIVDQAHYRYGIMHVYRNGTGKKEEEGLTAYFKSFLENFSNKKKILLPLHTRLGSGPPPQTVLAVFCIMLAGELHRGYTEQGFLNLPSSSRRP